MNGTAVVAGGLGGLAVAGGLTRAGWQVTVLERADAFSKVGAGIVPEPNAATSLDWLGFQAKLRALAMAQGTDGPRTSRGRWLVRSGVDLLRERYGVSACGLHRDDLLRLLVDPASDADLRTRRRVSGNRQDGEPVTVHLDGQGGRSGSASCRGPTTGPTGTPPPPARPAPGRRGPGRHRAGGAR